MNFFIALMVAVALCVVGFALIPILAMGAMILVGLGGLFLWLLPILIIADSNKTSGAEKAVWICAIIFLSWFAWVLYFFIAPLSRPRDDYRCY